MFELMADIPHEHWLPFAVFTCKKENICPYVGLAIFYGYFSAVDWQTEWIKQTWK